MPKKIILIVDDEEPIRVSISGILQDEGYAVYAAASGEEAIVKVEELRPDLVLMDILMPGMDGLEALEVLHGKYPALPVVMISGHGSIEQAVKATKLGAYDFLEKPLSMNTIVQMVRHVMDLSRLQQENRLLRQRIEKDYTIIGDSPVMQELRRQVEVVAPTDSWVLITGENGTGKELVARQIHRRSKRSGGPFVDVNCAAIPEELIESELFGHEKGAFTGASDKRRGKFDLADGGTIFLDEIADMSLKTQAKILRILQEQKFERVGGTETIDVQVRVIAATNKDLEEEIAAERFREDLYYRLAVVPIQVPPLRERLEDIPAFVDHFRRDFLERSGINSKTFSAGAIELMRDYHWPGNVREIKNVIERLQIMTRGDQVTADDVRLTLKGPAKEVDGAFFAVDDFREAKEEFEREFITRKLNDCDWNVTRTAELIGVERSHLHRKIKAYGIENRRANGQ